MTSVDCETTSTECSGGCTSRRLVLTGGALAAAGLLVGCSGSGSEASGDATTVPSSAGGDSGGTGGGDGGGGDGGGSEGGGGTSLGAAGEVPVGSAVIFADAQVVVAQPTKGEYVAFSSICTHQGCPVTEVADGEIVCPCHGSHFSIEDGAVLAGPATAPLEPRNVTVDGDELLLS